MSAEIQPEYLDTRCAAAYLSCSKSFLDQSRVRGDGPPYFKLGHSVRYKRDDLDAWMTANFRHSTSENLAHDSPQ